MGKHGLFHAASLPPTGGWLLFINMPENYSTLLLLNRSYINTEISMSRSISTTRTMAGESCRTCSEVGAIGFGYRSPRGNVGVEWGKLGLRLVD